MNKNVVFRRINGRIVPIKSNGSTAKAPSSNRPNTEQKSAAAKVVAGLGFSAAGGIISAKLARRHADLHNLARSANGALFRNYAARTRLEGMRAAAAAGRIKTGSQVIGASLIAAGVHKLLKRTDLDQNTKTAIAATSGLGANFAIRTAYTKVLGSTSLKFAAKHAIERILLRGHKL